MTLKKDFAQSSLVSGKEKDEKALQALAEGLKARVEKRKKLLRQKNPRIFAKNTG